MESALDPLDLQLLFDFASRGQEMKKIVDMINYEIEYVLRPHTAPARFIILEILNCHFGPLWPQTTLRIHTSLCIFVHHHCC